MRADLYLHNVRIFKTRTQATQACDRGQILLGNQTIKPSRLLKIGEVLDITRGDLRLVIRVIAYPAKRVGAPLVPEYMENLTPAQNFIQAAEARREKIAQATHSSPVKPDKKQLREIRKWMDAANQASMADDGED